MKTTKKKVTPLPKLLKKTQEVFNRFIRNRDKDAGCISCNGPVEQAGHYFSQGHHSALRFSEINTNGQCIRCNCYLSGNLIRYRQGLVKRYGEAEVERLELNADLKKAWKWDRIELEQLISKYK
jgi:hypothetical protein